MTQHNVQILEYAPLSSNRIALKKQLNGEGKNLKQEWLLFCVT